MTRPVPAPRRCALLASAAALALAAQAPTAQAGVFAPDVIDGPSTEIVSAGDVDVARDGTGAVAYLKREAGVPHLFVSRLVNGVFLAPERLDPALPAAADQPVVAASDGGRIAVAFVSGAQLNVALRPNAAAPFQAPQPIADGASNPSIDMSINGVSYVSFTSGGADVRAARLARDGTAFAILPDTIDIEAARVAGDGIRRSQVAVSADGTAVVVWGEADHVYARRLFGARLSTAPQDLNVASLEGHAAGAADTVRIDIEDDSSYAWVSFRQAFDDGRVHVVARRLKGSAFEPATFIDGLGFPAPGDAQETALELNGRGLGLAATSGAGGVNGAVLHDDIFKPGRPLGPGTPTSEPAVGIAENNDAYAAWLPGDGTAVMRYYDVDPAKRTEAVPGPVTTISRPDFGPVLPALGMDLGLNRAGDASAVFVQEGADGRRLVAGGNDRAPGNFSLSTTSRARNAARPKLSWSPSFDLWGPLTYRVEIDGQPVGETSDTTLVPVAPVADGEHTWRVVATDRRGQINQTKPRTLRIDATPPAARFAIAGTRKRGRTLKLTVTAADAPGGSGVTTIRTDWGDKTTPVLGPRASHRYRRRGAFTVRVSVKDAAGNVVVLKRRITVKK